MPSHMLRAAEADSVVRLYPDHSALLLGATSRAARFAEVGKPANPPPCWLQDDVFARPLESWTDRPVGSLRIWPYIGHQRPPKRSGENTWVTLVCKSPNLSFAHLSSAEARPRNSHLTLQCTTGLWHPRHRRAPRPLSAHILGSQYLSLLLARASAGRFAAFFIWPCVPPR